MTGQHCIYVSSIVSTSRPNISQRFVVAKNKKKEFVFLYRPSFKGNAVSMVLVQQPSSWHMWPLFGHRRMSEHFGSLNKRHVYYVVKWRNECCSYSRWFQTCFETSMTCQNFFCEILFPFSRWYWAPVRVIGNCQKQLFVIEHESQKTSTKFEP